jgi:hypothetical protein
MAVATKNKTLNHAEYARRAAISLAVEAVQRATGLSFNADDGQPLDETAIKNGWSIEQTLNEIEKAQKLLDLDDDEDDDEEE